VAKYRTQRVFFFFNSDRYFSTGRGKLSCEDFLIVCPLEAPLQGREYHALELDWEFPL
jgi:hypothetical protein